MSLDPTDVYPPRNLLGNSEAWGRQIENDQVLLKEKTASNSQSIQATNRNIAASLANLSEQLNTVSIQQAEILSAQTRIAETSQTVVVPYTINSNTSGSLGTTVVEPPGWASYAVVTGGMTKNDIVSTTRDVSVRAYVKVFDSLSLGVIQGLVSENRFYSNTWTAYQSSEPATATVVDLSLIGVDFELTAFRDVLSSGTGNFDILVFYSITWIE